MITIVKVDWSVLVLSKEIEAANGEWGWRAGYMVDSSKGHTPVRLSQVSPETSSEHLILPFSTIGDGDIVMANEYPISKD